MQGGKTCAKRQEKQAPNRAWHGVFKQDAKIPPNELYLVLVSSLTV